MEKFRGSGPGANTNLTASEMKNMAASAGQRPLSPVEIIVQRLNGISSTVDDIYSAQRGVIQSLFGPQPSGADWPTPPTPEHGFIQAVEDQLTVIEAKLDQLRSATQDFVVGVGSFTP